jgi:hypothetical protein
MVRPFLPLICSAHPSFPSSPAASSASPASEPPQSQARPLNATGASTEPKAKTNTSSSVPVPPSKRRRAKRSEEERIQYLRSDPYVAQFDAYRVLCASCNKWIRLRPNSTFCSIPWDAHRKSCLARKGAKEVAPPFVAADPDALKYDGGRVLCKACNGWIFVGQDSQAAQTWSQHRTQCRPASPSAPPAATTIPRSALPFIPICHNPSLTINAFHTASRRRHSTSSHWFRRTYLRHHEQPRKRKRIVRHKARLRRRRCLPRLNRPQRYHSQTCLCLRLLLAPAAANLVGEMQSSARRNCAQTRCWHRWSPTACSARCVASGFSFDRTARSVRTHGSSTATNVSFDMRRRRQRLRLWRA